MIIPVILAGGSGTRLWPLSRSSHPKQLLPLLSNHTMLQDTLLRLRAIPDQAPAIVICNEEHRFLVAEQLKTIDCSNSTILLEPIAKNTAPAIALAALHALSEQTDPILFVLPADHAIQDLVAFEAAIQHAIEPANKGKLVTFGITPTHAETGYGYIQTDKDSEHFYKTIQRFIEKPTKEKAELLIAAGNHYWNSGMFMFRASTYLNELKCLAPELYEACFNSYQQARHDVDFTRIDTKTFETCPNISIDYAVMEKTELGALVPLNAGWSDVGSWTSLNDIKPSDQNGNVIQGDVILENVKDCYLHSTHRMLAVTGVKDHIIVETADAILVAHKDHAQDIKKIVQQIQAEQRDETETHQKVFRPWGHYEILSQGSDFKVKRISLNPHTKISLQMHFHRSEHWVVIKGKAEVTCDEQVFSLNANESTFIPKTTKHRLANPHASTLEIIEVQLGTYLGEDDIVRYEDSYGRTCHPGLLS